MTELLVLCRDIVLYVATWFSGCRRLLGRDRGFPGRNRVVFLMFFCHGRGPHSVTVVFCFFFCDNVETEVPLLRPRRQRQEVRVAIGAWSRQRDLVS